MFWQGEMSVLTVAPTLEQAYALLILAQYKIQLPILILQIGTAITRTNN
jgi:hypothetical protein